MVDDPRGKLRLANKLVREQPYAEATAIYVQLASEYLSGGFPLKAMAVAKQVLSICDRHQLTPSAHALRILADAHSLLGLDPDPEAPRKRLAEFVRVRRNRISRN
jgi:hypothetical protein